MLYGMKNLLKTRLDPQTLKYIQQIASFKEQWDVAKNLKPDTYAGLKKTAIITSAGASTRIEGSHLSDKQILDRLENLHIQKIHDRDEAEVAGYIECINYIFDHSREIEISEHAIRSLHQMMCKYLSDDILPASQKGAYKNIPNSVVKIDHATGKQEVIFETTPPGPLTDTEMRDLVADYSAFIGDPNYSDLEVIAAFVVKFLAIHPFRDGNGRIARLLTNLCLIRQGYDFCIFSSHEKAIEDNKETYYISLRQTQGTLKTTHDLNPWFLFFLKILNQQVEYLKDKIVFKKEGTLTALEEKVLEIMRNHQPVTIGFLERNSNMKRVTLKNLLARLKKHGIISMEGSLKGSKYRIA